MSTTASMLTAQGAPPVPLCKPCTSRELFMRKFGRDGEDIWDRCLIAMRDATNTCCEMHILHILHMLHTGNACAGVNDVFEFLPIAAVVGGPETCKNRFSIVSASAFAGEILCIHGGIGDSISSLDDLRGIPKPIQAMSCEEAKSSRPVCRPGGGGDQRKE